MTLNGGPCPGMITSDVRSASWRLTSCTAVFILRLRQLSSSEQHSNKSPATSTVPTEVPFTWTLTSCPVWPGLGTTDVCGRNEMSSVKTDTVRGEISRTWGSGKITVSYLGWKGNIKNWKQVVPPPLLSVGFSSIDGFFHSSLKPSSSPPEQAGKELNHSRE